MNFWQKYLLEEVQKCYINFAVILFTYIKFDGHVSAYLPFIQLSLFYRPYHFVNAFTYRSHTIGRDSSFQFPVSTCTMVRRHHDEDWFRS